MKTDAPLGIAVIGAGFLGSQRAAAARVAKGTRLVAISDLDVGRAEAIAGRHKADAERSWSAMIRRPDVGAVVIATPHADHADQIVASLQADKHVLCEKPLTIRSDEARALCQLARERGLRLATGFNHRFYAPIRDLLDLVRRGEIGRVERVSATIGHLADEGFLRSWHTDVERSGGGTLADNGPHACDLIRQLLGEVSSVEGTTEDVLGLGPDCESRAVATFFGRDGGFADLTSSWVQAEGYLTFRVEGNTGLLNVGTAPWRLEGRLADGREITRNYLAPRIAEKIHRRLHHCERSFVVELESFAQLASADRPEHGSGWDGCRTTEMVEATYRSARSGSRVELNPLPVSLRRPGMAFRGAGR